MEGKRSEMKGKYEGVNNERRKEGKINVEKREKRRKEKRKIKHNGRKEKGNEMKI